VDFKNRGGYNAALRVTYYNPNGGTTDEIVLNDKMTGQDQQYDLGTIGNGVILEGAGIYLSSYVVGGYDAFNSTYFYYTANSSPTAVMKATGTTLNSGFDYDGIYNAISGTPKDKSISARSITFGLAEGESFSVGGSLISTAFSTLTSFGGLEGMVFDTSTTANTSTRSVFSYAALKVSGKKFFDYKFTQTTGYTYNMNFYIIVG
jgi:hypothetical protein